MFSLPIVVDKNSPINIKAQLIGQVLLLIANNELRSGDTLPTVVDLAEHLVVNHNTVAAVYNDLIKSNYLIAQRGKGTFVADNEIVEKIRSHKDIYTRLAEAYELATYSSLNATEFGVAAYSQALRCSYIPLEVVFIATKQYEESVYEAIREEIGVSLSFLSWSEISAKPKKSLKQLEAAELIITTHQLYSSVMEKVANDSMVFAIGIKPELELSRKLLSLEPKTLVLLVAEQKSEGEAMKASLQKASILRLDLQVKDIKEWEQDPTILEQAELIIVSQIVENYVRQQLIKVDRPILVFDFCLDLSNISLLKAHLAAIQSSRKTVYS